MSNETLNRRFNRRGLIGLAAVSAASLALGYAEKFMPYTQVEAGTETEDPGRINPEVMGQSVDTLPFLLYADPRKGLGELSQTQLADNRVGLRLSDISFQIFEWDENNIYLREDHKQDIFTPGTWMKRNMVVGEPLVSRNMRSSFQRNNPGCDFRFTNQPWNFTNTIVDIQDEFDFGGDLGRRRAMKLKYDYGNGYELFYFAEGWGNVGWQRCPQKGDPSVLAFSNMVNYRPRYIDRNVSCVPAYRDNDPSIVPATIPGGSIETHIVYQPGKPE